MKVKVKNNAELTEFHQQQLKKGLKTSQKRSAIIAYFLKKDHHFTVEELYNEIKGINPQIGYSTVYRSLKLLEKLGLANICRFSSNKVRFEPVHKTKHHDHFVCTACAKIIEFTHKGIEKLQLQVANKYSFLIKSHELKVYGLCSECQTRRRKS